MEMSWRKAIFVSVSAICGSAVPGVIEGRDDEDVVKQAQEHAQQVHQMQLSRDQALAMSRPA